MTWGFVAVGVAVAGSYVGSQAANKAAVANQIYQSGGEALQWKQNQDNNEAISAANLTNTIRTGYKVGLLNVQQAQAKKQALQQGFDLSKQKLQILGHTEANAAAAGTIGSSVDAIISDINSKAADQATNIDVNWQQTQENFGTQLTDLLNQGMDQMRSPDSTAVRQTQAANTSSFGQQLAGAAVAGVSTYASAQMSLGLGTKKTT